MKGMFPPIKSFRVKLVLHALLVSISSLLMAGFVLVHYNAATFKRQLLSESQVQADIMAQNSIASMLFEDIEVAHKILRTLEAEPDVLVAHLYRNNGYASPEPQLFASYLAENSLPNVVPDIDQRVTGFRGQALDVISPVVVDGEAIGWVYMMVSTQPMKKMLRMSVLVVISVMVLALFISLVLSSFFHQMLLKPLHELISAAVKVTQSKDYSVRAELKSDDELGQLTAIFNRMLETVEQHDRIRAAVEYEVTKLNKELEQKVEERTAQLGETNHELRKAFLSLKEAQSQLVESEKMASLGGLVAGVAHEINTPLGVALTATTHLETMTHELEKHFRDDQMTVRYLQKYIENAQESSMIIVKNLQRAASLVQSFKQVSVDQSSEQPRRLNVQAYLDELLLSLKPRIAETQVTVRTTGPEDLNVTTLPGALSQIFTNLIFNSLIHAFDPDEAGEIDIEFDQVGTELHWTYRDNGRGIPEAYVSKIFDPFFTTRRGQGGSGLGLSIIYNIVNQVLSGTLVFQNRPEGGVEFKMVFPVQ